MCEVVYILSHEIDDYSVVEDLICEILRCMEGGSKSKKYSGVDTITRSRTDNCSCTIL